MLLKTIFSSKDVTRSRPVRKATYELDEHLKKNAQHITGSLV